MQEIPNNSASLNPVRTLVLRNTFSVEPLSEALLSGFADSIRKMKEAQDGQMLRLIEAINKSFQLQTQDIGRRFSEALASSLSMGWSVGTYQSKPGTPIVIDDSSQKPAALIPHNCESLSYYSLVACEGIINEHHFHFNKPEYAEFFATLVSRKFLKKEEACQILGVDRGGLHESMKAIRRTVRLSARELSVRSGQVRLGIRVSIRKNPIIPYLSP